MVDGGSEVHIEWKLSMRVGRKAEGRPEALSNHDCTISRLTPAADCGKPDIFLETGMEFEDRIRLFKVPEVAQN